MKLPVLLVPTLAKTQKGFVFGKPGVLCRLNLLYWMANDDYDLRWRHTRSSVQDLSSSLIPRPCRYCSVSGRHREVGPPTQTQAHLNAQLEAMSCWISFQPPIVCVVDVGI
jgi:hypothetical protein